MLESVPWSYAEHSPNRTAADGRHGLMRRFCQSALRSITIAASRDEFRTDSERLTPGSRIAPR